MVKLERTARAWTSRHPALPGNHQRTQRAADARLSGKGITKAHCSWQMVIRPACITSSPLFGGKWLKHQPTLRIPWYRPLTSLHPALQRRRAEQHIICAVHAGLTRYTRPATPPDLAHHWKPSDNKRRWRFYLRSGAHWHNGQAISDEDILRRYNRCWPIRRAMRGKHVHQVSLAAPWCLDITLHAPDAMLAHRLAHHVVACLIRNSRISVPGRLPSPIITPTICAWSVSPGTLPPTRFCTR
jgi:hypothetical protein